MRLLKFVLLTALAIPILLACSLIVLLFLALSPQATLNNQNTGAETLGTATTLSQLAERSDEGLLTLKDKELSTIVRTQLRRAGVDSVLALDFEPREIHAAASLTLPIDFRRRYVNVQAELSETTPPEHIKVEQLAIGAIRIPPSLIKWLRPHLLTLCQRDDRCQLGLEAYSNVESMRVTDGALQVQYSLGAETLGQLGGRGLQVDDLELEPYFDALNKLAKNNARKKLTLHTVLQSVMQLAQQRSQQFSPVHENAAALMALAVQNANPRTRDVLFRANDAGRKLEVLRVEAHARTDLAHHFINSMALFLIGGSEFSDSVGVYKEYYDAMVGKHFDFSDIAGDRAGTMFARFATASETNARSLQEIILTEQNSAAYLPNKAFIEQLQKRSKKNARSKVDTIFPEIDEELAKLPLLN